MVVVVVVVAVAAAAAPHLAPDQAPQDELVELRSVLEQQLKGRSWKDSAGVPPVRAAVGQRLARLGLSRGISGSLLDAVPQRGGLDAQWRIAMQVLADLGPVAVMMRLVTKLLDDNFFACAFSACATLLPDYQRLAVKAGLSATSLRK